jgi:hypothetical protein
MSNKTPSYARPDPHITYNNGNVFDPKIPEEKPETTATALAENLAIDNYGQGGVEGSNSGLNIN